MVIQVSATDDKYRGDDLYILPAGARFLFVMGWLLKIHLPTLHNQPASALLPVA
jgi:hypothetical protein